MDKDFLKALMHVAIDAKAMFDSLPPNSQGVRPLVPSLRTLREHVERIAAQQKREGIPASSDPLLNDLRALLSSQPIR